VRSVGDAGAGFDHVDEDSSIGDATLFGSELLARWGLPRTSSNAVRLVYADQTVVHEPMARVLMAGHALASSVFDAGAAHCHIAPRDGLATIGVAASRIDELSAKLATDVDRIATFLMGAAT
jgi:hypothetical protein